MRKRVIIALVCVVCYAVLAQAIGFSGGLQAFTVSMKHVNSLIDDFNMQVGSSLPDLSVGIGLEASVPVLSLGRMATLTLGGQGLLARQTSRDHSISAGSLGIFARIGFAFARLSLAADLLGARGMLEFPEARLVGLSGWGVGMAGSAGYALSLTERLTADVRLGFRWLPFGEMTDSSGQKYRGRGTAFMDFSGICASIGIGWVVPERSNE